jgi:hypothetical protein
MKYNYSGLGLTTKERNAGKRKFNEYIRIYPHLYKLSDLQLLEHLVFLETLDERYKAKVGQLSRNATVKDSGIIPAGIQKQISLNTEEILKLKDKLGLFEEKEKLDAYQKINDILQKFKRWEAEHVLERKITCPFCCEPFVLHLRTDKYKAVKNTFFKNKILANPELWDAYKKGEINKQRYAKIIGTSEDFIDWLGINVFNEKSSS